MTAAQREGLQTHLQKWGLAIDGGVINSAQVFNNDHPTVLEIGFGMGDSLAFMAAAEPKQNFIGVEVHSPGIGRLLSLVARTYNEPGNSTKPNAKKMPLAIKYGLSLF